MSAQGTEADWYRHILYGLAGETFEAQEALDKFEAAVKCRALREAAEKIRREADGPNLIRPELKDAYWQAMHRAADIIDPEGADRDTP